MVKEESTPRPMHNPKQPLFVLLGAVALGAVGNMVVVTTWGNFGSSVQETTSIPVDLNTLSKDELLKMVVDLREKSLKSNPARTSTKASTTIPATTYVRPVEEITERMPSESRPSEEKLKWIKRDEKIRKDFLALDYTEEQKAERAAGYEANQFNQHISDNIPLRRWNYDTRSQGCIDKEYTAGRLMPSTSVIVVFYNEARSTLLRTAWSVLDRSQNRLVREVLLVDDGSTMPHLGAELDAEVATMPKTRVVRLGERVGLIKAKVEGVREATGEVVVFMDSHCEVNDGWLEPLLDRIVKNPKAVALPVIDATDAETFEVKEAIVELGVFTWSMYFYWLSPPQFKADTSLRTTDPFYSPTMAGGIFAMDRQYFWDVGAYDDGMDTWGGENFEMSFRIWMCGGVLEAVPCSHIAHVFRLKSPYTFKNRNPQETIARNLNRVAEVWMDEYKSIYYDVSVNAALAPDIGDISGRKALRERLECKSFDWYMNNVANVFMYVPIPENYQQYGRLRNSGAGECLYHEGNPGVGNQILAVLRTCDGPDGEKRGPKSVAWYHTSKPYIGQLRHEADYGSRCVYAHEIKKNARVSLARCYDLELNDNRLEWTYDKDTRQLILASKSTGCLAHKKGTDQVVVVKCNAKTERQKWDFVPV